MKFEIEFFLENKSNIKECIIYIYEKRNIYKDYLRSIINIMVELYNDKHNSFVNQFGQLKFIDDSDLMIYIIQCIVELKASRGEDIYSFFDDEISKIKDLCHLQIVSSNSEKKFRFDYLLYIPQVISSNVIILECLNSGPEEHKQELRSNNYIKEAFLYSGIFDIYTIYNAPMIIPLIPAEKTDDNFEVDNYQELMLQQLSKNTISIKDENNLFYKLDLQILEIISDAKKIVEDVKKVKLNQKSFIYGFSTSGNLASRLAFLHPDEFLGVFAGGINALIPLPISQYNENLPYPLGSFDYKEITGKNFDLKAYNDLPKFYFMGDSEDEKTYNTPMIQRYHDKELQNIIKKSLSSEMYKRLDIINEIFRNNEMFNYYNEDMICKVPNSGHNSFVMYEQAGKFFEKLCNEKLNEKKLFKDDIMTDNPRYIKGITYDFKDSNELLEYMNDFEYKWMDKNGNINDELDPSMYENYSFMTPNEVVINNCGICVDQSNYALVALSKMGYHPESYTIQFFREDTAPGHAFIIYEDNNKFYWFENAWGANKGIHEYETKEKLFEDITNKLFILENANLEEQKTLIIEKNIQYPYHSSYDEMDKIKELNKLVKYNNHYFHGSPKLLRSLETRQAHDDNNDKINSDNALFLTDSFLMASAYAFKDTIKEENINSKFNITLGNQLPFMTMENVLVDNELEGYIYVFDKNDEVINEPIGSNQFKSYKSLNPIDVIKIRYEDFNFLYDIKGNEVIKGVKL